MELAIKYIGQWAIKYIAMPFPEWNLYCWDYLKTEKKSRVFNCGYGTGSSVAQVVKAAKEVTGVDFTAVPCDRRQGDPPQLVANSELIQKELGWKPKYNDLTYIIKTAWEWEKKLKKRA